MKGNQRVKIFLKMVFSAVILLLGSALSTAEQLQPLPERNKEIDKNISASALPDSIYKPADLRYQRSGFVQFFMGNHYRDLWTEALGAEILDLKNFEGGVDVYNFTGGQQSTTFFARTEEGGHYVFRSVPKNPVVFAEDQDDPEQIMFNKSVIRDVLQDQISSSHPYGSMAMQPVLKGAGLYHTPHKLFYLPEQPGTEDFPETAIDVHFIAEQFVDVDYIKQFESNTSAIHSTTDLIEMFLEGEKIRLDAEWFLKARLITMLMGDWDRHEGQYFWVESGTGEERLIRPYQLDHDGNFFVMTGFLPSMATRMRPLRKFQHFEDDIREIGGLNEQSRYMDEVLLNELPRERWRAIAEELQEQLTDEILRESVQRMPGKAYQMTGEQIYSHLISRRQKLPEYADEYYELIVKDLDITGTTGNNLFQISDVGSDDLEIKLVVNPGTDSEWVKFHRKIDSRETRSVRLFGIDGINKYEFNLSGKLPLTVQVVDLNKDKSIEFNGYSSWSDVNVHDDIPELPEDFQFKFNTREFTNELFENYGYNYQEADDDLFEIMPSFRYNTDDGPILGGAVAFTTYRFRRYPYSTKQKLRARLATQSSGYTIHYTGEFVNVAGRGDLYLDMFIQAPNFSNNFFGLGNETSADRSSSFFDIRRDIYGIDAELRFNVTSSTDLGLALTYEAVQLNDDFDKFFLAEEAGLAEDDFDTHSILGFRTAFDFQIGDKGLFPRNRFEVQTGAHLTHNFLDSSTLLALTGNIIGSGSIFHEDIVLASRVGAATNTGDFRFFQANTLGDVGSFLRSNRGFFEAANFRGTPRDRFSGRTVFYQNTEIRTKLFHSGNYIAPGDFGIIALFDHGRVWAPGESSNVWHYSYGGGIWYNFYKNLMLSTTYARSDVDDSISLLFGFMF